MIEQASLVIGNDNFAVKENSFLGYALNQNLYVPREMDVVRATTATRVNEQGLIEVVPRNLFTYSEQFNDASWVKAGVSVTTNTTTAPDGTLTADSVIENSATATQHRMAKFSISLTSGTTYTISAYVKRGVGSRNVQFGGSGTGVWIRVYFDLTNGTVGSQVNGTGTITNVGDGWYKITATGVCDLTGNNTFFLANTNGTTSGSETYNGDGVSSIVWWGAQLESGSSATEYFPTTDRLDVPRVDYSNGTPSILVEPQRTNLALRSEQFDNASWEKVTSASITSSSIISPSGLTNANTLNILLLNSAVRQGVNSITSSTIYTFSFYAKKSVSGGANSIRFTTNNTSIWNTGFSTKYTLNDNWQKFTYSGNLITIGVSSYLILGGIKQDGTGDTDCIGNVDIWGAQLEVGSYQTSYIPTVASTVTRNADVISKTGISSLIGQTEGTLFVDIVFIDVTTANAIGINNGTGSDRVVVFSGSGLLFAQVRVGNVSQFFYNTPVLVGTRYKAAIAYKGSDFAFYVNGNQIAVGSTGTVPTCSVFSYDAGSGGSPFLGKNNSSQLYKTRLTNAELAQLTTL